MIVKLLTEQHLGFLSLKGGCRGSSKSTLFKVPHCWKSHATANLNRIEYSVSYTYRLVQYQGSSIVFDDSESSSSWCGEEGNPCPQCSTQIKGNSLANR